MHTNMKSYKNLALSVLAVATLGLASSCNYLDIEPENTLPQDEVDYSNTENMYQQVSGCYAALRTGGCHWVINMLTVIRDGDVWSGRVDDQADLVSIGRNYVYNSSFWGINEIWNQYYNMIKICNGALSALDKYAEYLKTDQEKANYRSYRGEVLILRSYAYYRLCQAFGDVTIIKDNTQTDLRRSTRDVVYQYVLEDLKYAAENCKKVRPNEMDHIGAFTAYTAEALAAKICLNMGKYDQVETYTEDIIKSGKFQLYSDFYQLFKIPGKLCNESLLECQVTDFGQGAGDYVGVDCFFISCGPTITNPDTQPTSAGGWCFIGYEDSFQQWATNRGETVRATTSFLLGGQNQPSGDFVAAAGNPSNTNCWNGKWYVPLTQFTPGRTDYAENNNVRIIRYAEVLLMNAEAKIRQSKNGDEPLNLVRKRANMPSLTGATVNDVMAERRMELCCEWGTRYEDLCRTGEAKTVLGPNGWDESKRYYPIPLSQLDLAPALKLDPYTSLQ